tara:strand:+ start:282 stop:524 length:243 start_codon:yes stop_codon:yes gene_type:complete
MNRECVDMDILDIIFHKCLRSRGADFIAKDFIKEMKKINISKEDVMTKLNLMVTRGIISKDKNNIYYFHTLSNYGYNIVV